MLTGSVLTHAQQQLPNPSFENWTTHNTSLPYEEPDTWFGASVQCSQTGSSGPNICNATTIKTTDSNTGTYAAKLVNFNHEDGSNSEGKLLYSIGSDGYANFTSKPNTLTGYYKFNKTSTDKISISVNIYGASPTDFVAYGSLNLTASKSSYTLFTVPLTYLSQTTAPQNIYVMISFNEGASVNSDFIVDNLAFTYSTTPTVAATSISAGVKFFPNPGKDLISFDKTVKNISIQSANGSVILTQVGDSKDLDITSLSKGMYVISYEYNEMLIHDKLIVE